MNHSVLSTDAVRAILREAGIRPSGNQLGVIAGELDGIAAAFLSERYFTGRDKRGRPRAVLGAKLRKQLFGDLYGVWIEFPGITRLPGFTYRPGDSRYTGPFVSFVMGFCAGVANHIEEQTAGKPDATWRGTIHLLRSIERGSGVHIRDGLRAIGVQKFKRAIAKVPH